MPRTSVDKTSTQEIRTARVDKKLTWKTSERQRQKKASRVEHPTPKPRLNANDDRQTGSKVPRFPPNLLQPPLKPNPLFQTQDSENSQCQGLTTQTGTSFTPLQAIPTTLKPLPSKIRLAGAVYFFSSVKTAGSSSRGRKRTAKRQEGYRD